MSSVLISFDAITQHRFITQILMIFLASLFSLLCFRTNFFVSPTNAQTIDCIITSGRGLWVKKVNQMQKCINAAFGQQGETQYKSDCKRIERRDPLPS